MEFINNLQQIHQNWKPFQKWDIEQQKKEFKTEKLRKKYPPSEDELKLAQKKGEVIVDCIDKMDKESISKSQDALLAIRQGISLFTSIPPLIGLVIGFKKGGKEAGKVKAINGYLIGASISSIDL